MDIERKLRELPAQSGVYLMLDADGKVIYVGKARSLKNRVRQYFRAGNKTAKTIALVNHIVDFRYIITSTEVEALVLENNLIKKYSPKYNILLKDDKSYPFIRIDLKQDYPCVETVRKLKNDGAKYFGPYMQGITVKDINDLIHSAYPLRNCKLDLKNLPSSHRPCLNAHIGRCLAPCAGGISAGEYHKMIEGVVDFLKGNDKTVQRIIENRMKEAADRGDFETAIFYRDKLRILDKLIRRQIAALPKDFNLDVFSAYGNGIFSAVSMLVVRGGKLVGGDNFPLVTDEDAGLSAGRADAAADDFQANQLSNMLEQFIVQFYSQNPTYPDEIVVNMVLPSENALENLVSGNAGRKINIVKPVQGIRGQLADMAVNNAKDYLDNYIAKSSRREKMTLGAIRLLAEKLRLPSVPYRMECYDISHISGTDMVASMAVFEGGKPASAMYRRFKIRTVEKNNDFACMREVLIRRLTRLKEGDADPSFSKRPDLIVVDGGKGQLAYAEDALHALGMEDLAVISLAKREEEVFKPDSPVPYILDKSGADLQVLQRIRDEAHRFAVTYHRSLRSKGQTASELKQIEGIGAKKTDALYRHFKNIGAVKKATEKELAEVKGISLSDAKKIRAYFNGKNNT